MSRIPKQPPGPAEARLIRPTPDEEREALRLWRIPETGRADDPLQERHT
jgi:hypothetical protein